MVTIFVTYENNFSYQQSQQMNNKNLIVMVINFVIYGNYFGYLEPTISAKLIMTI